MSRWVILASLLWAEPVLAQETYRYDRQTKASEVARDLFGPAQAYERTPGVNMGRVSAGVSSSLDCGRLDLRADLKGEFDNLQKQVKAFLQEGATGLAQRGALMATCYAYPTVCAQLRHDFLALQANLNLRAQACRAIDSFIDTSAEKGAKQLRAEAQAECVREFEGSLGTAGALRECQNKNGLALRDFQAGLEKRFTTKKQKVLEAITSFARSNDKPTYHFLAGVLGEIEVQQDGYWQPLFDQGMTRPHDVAQTFLAEGEERTCGDLERLLDRRAAAPESFAESTVAEVIRRRLTRDDARNLGDLETEDRKLACAALGRAIGQVAAEKASAKAEAILASGLLNTAIPDGLRDEYRGRGEQAFDALRKAVQSDQIPPLEEVRQAVAQLARTTREKNRIIAGEISAGRLENYRQDAKEKSDCTDTLSCSSGG